ncbi:MAG: hypothetical protein ATN36_08800 [Epulopiscium sp. Nele67-Bin005]|nr:MAG: hypothetical protein ATN36_08800 [Epulopiscium sp. Nele67-Bin005]
MLQSYILSFKIENYKPIPRDVEKLRGYIASQFQEEVLLHNHQNDFEFRYKLPLIQYKIINQQLAIVGYTPQVKPILLSIFDSIQLLNIEGKQYLIKEKNLRETNDNFAIDTKMYNYKFITPWLALNQENFKLYKEESFDLNKQLQNNILSNFKDLGIMVNTPIICNGKFEPKPIVLKNVKMVAFTGNFESNVILPNYMGIGKRKSLGFGTIINL